MADLRDDPPPCTPSTTKKRARTTTSTRSHVLDACITTIFVLDIEEVGRGGEIYIYGCTNDRKSVLLSLAGFRYSFFVELPAGVVTSHGLSPDVEHDIQARIRGHVDFTSEAVTRRSLVLYRNEPDALMLRVYPTTQRSATNMIVAAFQAVLGKSNVILYDTQVDVSTRFSMDSGIRGGDWLEVPVIEGAANSHEDHKMRGSRKSACDIELACTWDQKKREVTYFGRTIQIHSFAESQRWSALPPLKIVSLSVERHRAPVPDSQWRDRGQECPDPIRMISMVTTYENGGHLPHSRTKVLMLNLTGLEKLADKAGGSTGKTTRKVGGLRVGGSWVTRLYKDEAALLQAFDDFMIQEDPSLVTGFEVGESLRVLLGRAEALKMRTFGTFSRRRGEMISVKSQQSYGAKWVKDKPRMSATTNQEGTEVHCPGRVVLDLMRVIQMSEALRLYTLGDISMHVLGRTFEVLDTGSVEALLTEEDSTGWARAMEAGLSPAVLALDVIAKKNAVAELVEIARVTGMSLAHVYIRGQMARVTSMLQIHASRQGVVVPTSTEGLLDKAALVKSALLLDPSQPSPSNPEGIGTVGLHTNPVAVLDFRSLYPSIMIHHNLCYSTLIRNPSETRTCLSKDGIFSTPIGACFVKSEVRRGVIPSLLADLLEARSQAQKMLKEPYVSEGQRRVLDARQKAFKLAANAVYGFTGATVNSLFSREIGDSVLALGREYMSHVISLVGKDHPELKVVYGDTDSVFVEYPAWTSEAAETHSKELLTPALNKKLPSRVQLKHEKVLAPLLLQHIRRYAGYEYVNGGPGESPRFNRRSLHIKGMEAVARNSMPFLVNMMEDTLAIILTSGASSGRVDLEAVKETIRRRVAALMTNKIDLYSLTWTKGLWRLGEYDAKLPHVHLVAKLELQDPRRQFRVGERVAYVFVQREASAPLYRKAESPSLALTNNMTLDLMEYLKQIRMPMVRMLQLVMPMAEAEELFKPSYRAAPAGKVSGVSSISHFFAIDTGLRCLNCRTKLPKSREMNTKRHDRSQGGLERPGTRLCASCKDAPLICILPCQEALRFCETEHQKAYSHCSRCQRGSRHWKVLCFNETCPVMYHREKFAYEREQAALKVEEMEAALSPYV